jgi:hypothetical protein
LIITRKKRRYDVTVKECGGIWDDVTWAWTVTSEGETIAAGVNSWRTSAIRQVKRTIRLHAKGKVDTAGSSFTIWR